MTNTLYHSQESNNDDYELKDICAHDDGEWKMIPDYTGPWDQMDKVGSRTGSDIIVCGSGWRKWTFMRTAARPRFCILTGLRFLIWRKRWYLGERGAVLCTLMRLCLGLGDSTDNTVQDSKVLLKDHKKRVFISGFLMRMSIKTSAHSQFCFRDGILTMLASSINTSKVFCCRSTVLGSENCYRNSRNTHWQRKRLSINEKCYFTWFLKTLWAQRMLASSSLY